MVFLQLSILTAFIPFGCKSCNIFLFLFNQLPTTTQQVPDESPTEQQQQQAALTSPSFILSPVDGISLSYQYTAINEHDFNASRYKFFSSRNTKFSESDFNYLEVCVK